MKATKFDASSSQDYLMTVNKCTVGFNMPFALRPIVDAKGDEHAHESLPPYHKRKAFLVDEWPACPKDWLRSTGRIKSYFVPIQEGKGMWLDFNSTHSLNHHVAVVVSVQGVNAITGMPIKEGASLEQYVDNCPRHKKPFGPDRLCKDCGYRWPKQSYLASTAQTNGTMWIDGFRAENGVIRQYVLTASKIHGVAANVIGEDRVFALGISFFLSKEQRPVMRSSPRRGLSFAALSDSDGAEEYSGLIASAAAPSAMWSTSVDALDTPDMACLEKSCDDGAKGLIGKAGPEGEAGHPGVPLATYDASMSMTKGGGGATLGGGSIKRSFTSHNAGSKMGGTMMRSAKMSAKSVAGASAAPVSVNYMSTLPAGAAAPVARAPISPVTVKKMEVGAGARVDQEIEDDPNPLTFWNDEPEGLIILNYCTEEEAERIFAGGKVDVEGDKEGFMKNIPKTKVEAEAKA